mgnify:CR=1 FL=1
MVRLYRSLWSDYTAVYEILSPPRLPWTPPLSEEDDQTRIPKNGISRSKRLLKPQPLPHQYWGLELRTSLTGAS